MSAPDTKTPTPRTDEAGKAMYGLFVLTKFARQLETELNEAREELAQVRSERDSVTLVLMRDIESDSIVASCECMTKTNEVRLHKPGCKYRLISERDDARAELAALKAAQNQTPLDRPDRAGWWWEWRPDAGEWLATLVETRKAQLLCTLDDGSMFTPQSGKWLPATPPPEVRGEGE
jgi:hypothetical protein